MDTQRLASRRGRPPKGEAGPTRERLLDAALKLFAEHGFAATTVRQIAQAVGVTDPAIYAHFRGKQALFDALLSESGPPLFRRLVGEISTLIEQHPAEMIPNIFQRLVESWDQPRTRLFTSVLLRNTPEKINEAITLIHSQLTPVVQAWTARGWMRDDVSPELLAWELLAPLATIRLSLLHSGADETERKRAHELAHQHLAFYVQTNVGTA